MRTFRILTLLVLIFAIQSQTFALPFGRSETLHYKILYKWGMIQKMAGTAEFTLTSHGNYYTSVVTAKSAPWADKIYCVRDTLSSTFSISDILPTRYERIAHEGGRYSHDVVNFNKQGNTTYAKCIRERRGKGETNTTVTYPQMNAIGEAIDMLSSFYFIRTNTIENLEEGKSQTINIFSTKRKEILTLTNNGIAKLKIDGKIVNTIKITFTFTSDGRKHTSKPITAWLSTEPYHIPLKLEGELPIGKVQCIFMKK